MKQTITRKNWVAIGLLGGFATLASAQGADSIGTVTFQVGDARLDRNGQAILLTKGQELKVGDRILTGADGHVHVRMVDSGFISVRPSSRLHIQSYNYAPNNPAANRVGILLENGVSRTISGRAGEAAREHYRFNTPVAAIGLRGTDYVVQSLTDTTRVSVLKGAVTLSPYGPDCQANTLSPCTGPFVRELAAVVPHAYMEVRTQGGPPVIVPPENGRDAPNRISPPRPEERQVQAERQLTSTLAADALPSVESRPEVVPPPGTPEPVLRPEIAWGRWSSVALQDTPTLVSLKTDDREITYVNSLFGLLRPAGTPQLPTGGVVAMNYAQGEAYSQSVAAGASSALVPVALSNGKLQLDFNNRQFSTSLEAAAAGKTYALHAQGPIQFQGFLYSDASRSNMTLAGTLSNNANEAGYLFDTRLASDQTLIGATRWKR